jgi:predicted HTH transcriptional regulator
MREALVNLFMHQDYGDPSAAAQVELWAERATFFNTGFHYRTLLLSIFAICS